MKKVVKIIVIFLLAICMSAIMQTKSNAADIEISKTKKILYVGAEFNLKITGTNKKITWTSSNKKVATVSSKGRVKAKKKGTTEITAKIGKQKLKCAINYYRFNFCLTKEHKKKAIKEKIVIPSINKKWLFNNSQEIDNNNSDDSIDDIQDNLLSNEQQIHLHKNLYKYPFFDLYK